MSLKTRTLAALLCVAMLVALGISGCTQSAPASTPAGTTPAGTTPAGTTPVGTDPATITGKVTHFVDSSTDKDYIKKLIPDFNKVYPNIKVDVLTVPNEQFDAKLQTLVASGDPPEVTSHYGHAGFAEFLSKGMIQDLTPLMTKYNFDPVAAGIPEKLVSIYNENGKQYGIPVSSYVGVLVYNKDMFDAAKIPYPTADYEDNTWTFDKMLGIAKQLTKDTDSLAKAQYGLYWSWGAVEREPLYFGAKSYSDDTWKNGGNPSEIYFDSPDYVKALQRINDLIYVDKVMPTPSAFTGLSGGASGDAFNAGKIGMEVVGSWVLSGADQLPFKVGVAAVPLGPNANARDEMYTDPLMILKGCKDPDAAINWIKFVTSTEGQTKAVQYSQNPPANQNAYDTFYSSLKGIDQADMKKIQEGGVKYGTESANHLVAIASQVASIAANELSPMENDNAPASQVCKQLQDKIGALLKK